MGGDALNVPFLQHSTSWSEKPTHALHIWIDVDAIIFVLPIAHILCWEYATSSSTLLDGLRGNYRSFACNHYVFFAFHIVRLYHLIKILKDAYISSIDFEFC
jgi:hypothetical protein